MLPRRSPTAIDRDWVRQVPDRSDHRRPPDVRPGRRPGLGTLLGALFGYYMAARFVLGPEGGTEAGIVVFWTAIALVGGPIFGVAGHWWRHRRDIARIAAISLLGGALIAEGIYVTGVVEDPAVGWVEIVVGILSGASRAALRTTSVARVVFIMVAPTLESRPVVW